MNNRICLLLILLAIGLNGCASFCELRKELREADKNKNTQNIETKKIIFGFDDFATLKDK